MTMYDYPYRVEYSPRDNEDRYQVVHSGEGIICEGRNLGELRRLVEAANEQAASEERGR
jgi:hypothetical protein